MVVNQSKTELMMMQIGKTILPEKITLLGSEMSVLKEMKVLGVTFDNRLHLDAQLSNVMKKAQRMISGLKVIREKLSEEQFLRVATAQYYSAMYYGIQVWLNDSSVKSQKEKLNVLHYKLLRVALMDWKRDFPREMLDLLGRSKPGEFADYSFASTIIKCTISNEPARQAEMIKKNSYNTRRNPDKQKFYNNAMGRVGWQAIWNRMSYIVPKLNF